MPKGKHIRGTVDRMIVVVPLAQLAAMNAAAAAWDPDIGGGTTFGKVRLSSSGAEPATHTACSTRVTPGMRSAISGRISQDVKVYRQSDRWTWLTVLRDLGLRVIERK